MASETRRERDALDELCEAIEKFGSAQFQLGAARPPTMLASLEQARIAHEALWRVITRILESAASAIAEHAPLSAREGREPTEEATHGPV